MAISHVCLGCGRDLARVRPVRDPAVGWPIVRCPACDRVSIRRRHPVGQLLRWLIRLDAALTGVVVRLLSGFVVAAGASATLRFLLEADSSQFREPTVPVQVIALMILSLVGLGTWVALAIAHWRWWIAFPVTLLGLCAIQLTADLDIAARPAKISSLPARIVGAVVDLAPMAAESAAALCVLLPVMLLGILPGLGLRWLGRRLRHRRFRWYRGLARRGRFIPG